MVQDRAPAAPRDRRREILLAASGVFRRTGFHRAGMRDIARAAGIAVGKLYYWFDGKDALLAYCQEDCLDRLLRMARRVGRLDRPAPDRLFHLIVGHLRCLNEWTPGSLAHLEVESLPEPHRGRIQGLRDRYERHVRGIVRRGAQEGTFREVDPKVAALAVLGAANWSVKWYRPGGRHGLVGIARAFAEHLVRGLLSPAAGFTPPAEDPFAGTEMRHGA